MHPIRKFDVEHFSCWTNTERGEVRGAVPIWPPQSVALNCGHPSQWHYTQCGPAVAVMFSSWSTQYYHDACWEGVGTQSSPRMIQGVVALTHWDRDKMAAISQTTFSNAFPVTKMCEFRLRFHFFPKGSTNNIPALVQIMAWCRPGDKALSEPMMVSLLTYICVSRPQRVNSSPPSATYMRQ